MNKIQNPDRVVDYYNGHTILIDAILKNNQKDIKDFLEAGANPVKQDKLGKTPLHHAARLGQMDTVRALLDHGAQINAVDNNSSTALFDALDCTYALEMVEYLLSCGADANIQNNAKKTPLHAAAEKSNKQIMRRLIPETKDINHADITGWTPLHIAAKYNKMDIAEELLSFGANANKASNNGYTPLKTAVSSGINMDLIELLIRNGAYVGKNSPGDAETPLLIAIDKGRTEIVRLLLKYESALDVVVHRDVSPLLLAVRYRHLDIVTMLLHAGADPTIKNGSGLTAYEMARNEHKLFPALELFEKKMKERNIEPPPKRPPYPPAREYF